VKTPTLRAYMTAEIAARVEYALLPWRERLVTRPPVGWRGAWTAQVLSRLAAHGREHREKEGAEQ
jgi:hypothetical protein